MGVIWSAVAVSWGQNVPGYVQSRYVLPPHVVKQGCTFAGSKVPLNQKEAMLRVQEQVNLLLMDRRFQTMDTLDRLVVYGPTLRAVLEDEKIPEDLVYFAAILSGLVPTITARNGGIGIWAIPGNKRNQGSGYTATSDWDDRKDPVISTRLAATILKGLLRTNYQNDWFLALSAYVDGTEAVDRVVNKAPGFSFWDLVMPPSSEVLIPRVVALKVIDTHKEFYGISVVPLAHLTYEYLDRIKLEKDLPLHVVAHWCGVNPRLVWELNPGVDPLSGILPKADKTFPQGLPLRVPQGMRQKVTHLLAKEGYVSN